MVGLNMVRQKIKIVAVRGGKKITYYRKDLGKPGKGKKLPIKLKPGLMTKIANEMGYERVTDIPDSKIDEYARRLVEAYGAKRAFGMAHIQAVYRMNEPSQAEARRKFEAIRDSIDKQFDWRKTNGYITVPAK
jgi:hypothetical protein